MQFQEGNQFWKQRTKHGRDKLFSDPELLMQEALVYFENTSKRKWLKKDWVGKEAIEINRESETPFTKSGLCLFLGCDWRTLESLKKDPNPDFLQIITYIEQIIYTQKIEGASVGAFNASIVARELGLADKQDVTSDGKKIKQVFNIGGQTIEF